MPPSAPCARPPREPFRALQSTKFSDHRRLGQPQVHVYELTHHEDKYDLRYRLKDKIYLPSVAPSTLSSFTMSPSHAGESKEEPKRFGLLLDGDRPGSEDGTKIGCRSGLGEGRTAEGPTFLLVTWSNVVLCEWKVVQLYNFAGTKVMKCLAPPCCVCVLGYNIAGWFFEWVM